MKSNDILLPCPFCGGEAVIDEENNGIEVTYGVHCPNCHCASIDTGTFTTKQEIIDIWNHRYEPPNEPLTIEELESMVGEPVYIVENGVDSYWAIVGNARGDIYTEGIEFYDKFCEKGFNDYGECSLYEDTWLAYRRKPKMIDLPFKEE